MRQERTFRCLQKNDLFAGSLARQFATPDGVGPALSCANVRVASELHAGFDADI